MRDFNPEAVLRDRNSVDSANRPDDIVSLENAK